MKYQYTVKDGRDSFDELWVCADCRKNNSDMILVGKWRLIDKSVDPKLPCRRCCVPG